MSHTSMIFESQPVQVQNVNGFDLSHIFTGTSKTGQLVPVLRKLLMQGSKISVGAAVNVELPPLASSFFGRIDFCIELFFCPCSVLYGGWRQFISNQVATMFPSGQDSVLTAGGFALPVLDMGLTKLDSDSGIYIRSDIVALASSLDATNDGLSDYLGVRIAGLGGDDSSPFPFYVNMLPYLAYHKIVDVFYRNCSTTKTWFAVNPNVGSSSGLTSTECSYGAAFNGKNVSLVWHSFYSDYIPSGGTSNPASSWQLSPIFNAVSHITFPDNVSLLSTRQRTYERDYFTAGSVTPQQGNPATLQFSVDAQGDGEFTVHALRSIVALQRFEEKLNYDPSYRGVMRNLFGSSPSDALLDEPSYIGRLVLPVYQKSVYQQNQQSSTLNGSNPFVNAGSLGARGAYGSFSGEGQFCKGYKIGCFGYLMALASLVPHAMYGYGTEREMLAKSIGDFPFPDLQTVGMDGTFNAEIYTNLDFNPGGNPFDTFNYLPRYSWMKYKCDMVTGELRPGKTLESFVLQRVFTDVPEFGTDFVTIAQTDLDGVFATDVATSKLSCWFEIYWVFKATMPLAAFCIPTLGELQDVHTIHTTQGGARL